MSVALSRLLARSRDLSRCVSFLAPSRSVSCFLSLPLASSRSPSRFRVRARENVRALRAVGTRTAHASTPAIRATWASARRARCAATTAAPTSGIASSMRASAPLTSVTELTPSVSNPPPRLCPMRSCYSQLWERAPQEREREKERERFIRKTRRTCHLVPPLLVPEESSCAKAKSCKSATLSRFAFVLRGALEKTVTGQMP